MSLSLSEDLKSVLQAVAARLATPGKGLLAADESTSTIGKRFEKAGLKNEEEERRAYRELYVTSPGIGQSVSGVIMFKETLYQKTSDGKPFVECLREKGVEPGIKVDEGLQPLDSGLEGETWTKGLENLAAAAKEYKAAGATFAKWRAVLRIQPHGPSDAAVLRNAQELAEYAAICQAAGLVPVVEPEVLIDGDHDIVRFREVTERVVAEVVNQMWHKGVFLEGSLLKPQMVIPGTTCPSGKASPQDIAYHTVTAMRRVVPAAMPGIMFLSGGQTEEEATINLNAINLAAKEMGRCPWSLSFSFGRALQHSALQLWAKDHAKAQEAKKLFLAVASVNSAACVGKYDTFGGPHPTAASVESLYEGNRGHY